MIIRKIFITIIAVVLVASACAVPVYADSPNFDGFTTDIIDNTYGYALGVRDIYQNALDYLLGKKTFADFVSDGFRIATENNLDFLYDTFQSINENDMTPLDIVKLVVNSLNGYISNNGGNISTFPVSGTQIGIPGGGYVEFYDQERSNQPGFFDLNYRVFAPDGTLAYQSGWSLASYPPSGSAPFFNIIPLDYSVSGSGTLLTVGFDYYPFHVAPVKSREVLIPWVVLDGTFDNITETPDVDGLSDDELVKYIKDIIKNLENTYPDLSTIEGKLQEIINQLNKLNDGGCDCGELASAIESLGNLNNQNFGALASLLNEIKNLLDVTTGDDGNTDLSGITNRLNDINDNLKDIKKELKNIRKDLSDLTEDEKTKEKTSLLSAIKTFKGILGVDTVESKLDRYTEPLFGKRSFAQKNGEIYATYSTSERSFTSVLQPHIYFSFMGYQYDLFEWITFVDSTTLNTVKRFISFVLVFGFLMGLYRSLPSFVSPAGRAVIDISSDGVREK